jgi:hypothetical protein
MVADDSKHVTEVVSDAVHAAHKCLCEIALVYKGCTIKVSHGSSYPHNLTKMRDLIRDAPGLELE